jgi:3',5'-cyclic AMP phosphodiesterase CpdA
MFSSDLTRREFLGVAGGAAAVGLLTPLAGLSDTPAAADKKPLLRFVQINDTHVQAHAPPAYKLANEKLRHLVAAFNKGTYFPRPDFVLGIGDIISGGSLKAIQRDYALLRPILAELKCPFYPVMGNHEDRQQEGKPEYVALFAENYGGRKPNYTFQQGGIEFVVFDDSGATPANRTEVGRERRRWLRQTLEAATLPVILCCHIPLVPVRDNAVLGKSFGFKSWVLDDDELLKLVDAHADRILAVLSGHLHLTGMVRRKGVYHISISGTGSYPCDFAVYEVYADRIHVRVLGLPKELTTPETNLHGRPRHKTDYIDAAHPTPLSYVSGNASERTFDIPRNRTARHP